MTDILDELNDENRCECYADKGEHYHCVRCRARDEIERLRSALAAEREECAKVAEIAGCGRAGCTDCYGGKIAAAIRARTSRYQDSRPEND